MNVREIAPSDAAEWARMRRLLWPDGDHRAEIESYFRNTLAPPLAVVFVAERRDGSLAGFLELSLRPYAEGCESTPVPFIEGWFVDAEDRGSGTGRALVSAAEEWARQHGFREIASDVEIANEGSIAAHRALGYEEVSRVVCFRRTLFQED